MAVKKLTSVSRKFIGTPITNEEKYKRLSLKNNNIEKLKDIFDLEVGL